jgi:aspartate aminotransferase-like enzyme
MLGRVIFKLADNPSEFDQIHRLNYRIFAEEIGQYTPDGSGLLVDRFHDKNIYCIAVQNGRVLGMVAANDQSPFSIETRLSDLAVLDTLRGSLLEVRLLALEPHCRHRTILAVLLWELYRYAGERRYLHLIISGIADKAQMYQRFGFRALGPAVASGAASFIPMVLSLENPSGHMTRYTNSYLARRERSGDPPLVSLMPGPVRIAPAIQESFKRSPVSHRSSGFIDTYEKVRATLGQLCGGMHVGVFVGSGTMANDTVAMHLRTAFGDAPGLLLVNGEFGERIAMQASSAGLQFRLLRWRWGEPWNLDEVAGAMTRHTAWVWAVHLETSTGVLNRLSDLVSLASGRGARLAVDCISSVGAVPLPTHGVWMATGVSGKAIGAYAGLSFVFASTDALERASSDNLPSSMDVKAAVTQVGPRFTVASPLLFALESALVPYSSAERARQRFAQQQSLGRHVRSQLGRVGIQPVASERDAAPCVTSFAIPRIDFLETCRRAGFELGSESRYLRDRGWAQIATMGAIDSAELDRLFDAIKRESPLSVHLAALSLREGADA